MGTFFGAQANRIRNSREKTLVHMRQNKSTFQTVSNQLTVIHIVTQCEEHHCGMVDQLQCKDSLGVMQIVIVNAIEYQFVIALKIVCGSV